MGGLENCSCMVKISLIIYSIVVLYEVFQYHDNNSPSPPMKYQFATGACCRSWTSTAR